MDNEKEIKEDSAPAVDEALLQRMVAAATAEIMEKEAPKGERQDPNLGSADKSDAPSVKGERVPQWERRAFQLLHGIRKSQSTERGLIVEGHRALAELDRQTRAMADFQKDEEQAHVDRVISNSGLSARVQNRLHSTLTGPSGEFVLPKPFLAELFVYIETFGLARQKARAVNILSGNSLNLKSIATKPQAFWTGENVLLTESDLALGENMLNVKKIGAITSVSNEQEEDAFVSLLPTWLELLAESIAQKEDEAWLRGDGTSTYGLFTGITNYANAQSTVLGASDLNFSNVVEGDFRAVKNKLSPVRRNGAEWIIHRGMHDIMEQFETSGGHRIYQPNLVGAQVSNFLGFPVNLSEAMVDATTDVANVDFAILGNYSRSLMGIARGITVESSKDAVLSNDAGAITYNAFQQDGMLLKISTRVGFAAPTAMQDGFSIMTAPAS